MNKLELFVEAIKSIKTVGTVTFSSKYLVEKMTEPIDFSSAKCIVELGAGNGCITKQLLQKMRPDAKLISFEINSKFIDLLKAEISDKRLVLIHDSAEYIKKYVQAEGFESADYVVSSIPLVWLSDDLNERIINNIQTILKPSGLFLQLSYTITTYKKFNHQFPKIQFKFTPLNLPPAFVFVCKKEINTTTPAVKVKKINLNKFKNFIDKLTA